MHERGLAADGTIAREGALNRVGARFGAVVTATRARIAEAFDEDRRHSAYLYGSIPRGTAVPGRSDLDLLVVLRAPATDADRATAEEIERALDETFPQIDGVGLLLSDVDTLLGDVERYDGGFFVTCLCTPLLGDDLAERLPRYRPTSLLARETNGDLAELLPGWRARLADPDADLAALSRRVGRKLVRTGFTLIMPRWGGWTSDLDASAELFGRYYPEHAARMRSAAELSRTPTDDTALLAELVDDLGVWLAAEYTAVHGERLPRP